MSRLLPSVTHMKGDLIELFQKGEFDIIAHGCNGRGIMGAGLAKQIADEFGDVPIFDQMFAGLGIRPGGILPVPLDDGVIVNMYTQVNPGANARLRYIEKSCDALARWIQSSWAGWPTVGLPRIGAGIGGLQWDAVLRVIESSQLPYVCDLILVEYEPRMFEPTL